MTSTISSDVEVPGVPNPALHIMAGDPEKWSPDNRESADHSMPYVTAVALHLRRYQGGAFRTRPI